MQPSRFTVRVPVPEADAVFLLHTLSDAQVVVSPDVDAALFPSGCPTETPAAGLPRTPEVETLASLGFLVPSRADDDAAIAGHFERMRSDTQDLRLTVLTTLRCNFGCDYCVQGDHADAAAHMSLETAGRLADWLEGQLDEVRPVRLVLTFFGGEPLLNVPVIDLLAQRAHAAGQARGISVELHLITNGLLLTRELVDRLVPLGLRHVKVTLDGDRDRHDRQRPLRGGQGTFDRIFENVRAIAGRCGISIGGNVDADAIEDCERLLDRLAAEPWLSSLVQVSFKPIVRRAPASPPGVIPLAVRRKDGSVAMPATSACDTCAFADDAYVRLRRETASRGLPAPDGLHMGPCELHRRHAHAVGPDGTRYVCPGYAGEATHAIGHVWRPPTDAELAMADRRERLAAWRACGDCAFVPVCAGGCSVAAHHEQHDMEAPACHKPAFEAAVVDLARAVVAKEWS